MESDEIRIFNAAHLMVASLAGSLAHVTCKVFILALWGLVLFYLLSCPVYFCLLMFPDIMIFGFMVRNHCALQYQAN